LTGDWTKTPAGKDYNLAYAKLEEARKLEDYKKWIKLDVKEMMYQFANNGISRQEQFEQNLADASILRLNKESLGRLVLFTDAKRHLDAAVKKIRKNWKKEMTYGRDNSIRVWRMQEETLWERKKHELQQQERLKEQKQQAEKLAEWKVKARLQYQKDTGCRLLDGFFHNLFRQYTTWTIDGLQAELDEEIEKKIKELQNKRRS